MSRRKTTPTDRARAHELVGKWTLILAVLLLGAASSGAEVSTLAEEPEIPGEILVWFDESVSAEEARDRLEALGAREIEARFTPGLYRVVFEPERTDGEMASVSLSAMTRTALDQISVHEGVLGAEPHLRGSGGYMPDDPLVGRQWHLANANGTHIQAETAWGLTRGSSEVTVAVLDSGILLDHPEFAGRLAFEDAEYPPNGVDDDGNGLVDDYRGWDFADGDNDPTDEHGHGTWTASVLAANAGNDFGIAGVDHASRLLILRVLGADNRGSSADLIDALTYVTERGDVDLVNMSLVRFSPSELLAEAIERAAKRSVLIACAGNDGPETADGMYPGAHPATISVGATDDYDERVAFSSTGSSLSLVAPGWEIEVVDTTHPYRGDASTTVSGCSFATPIVTGIAALLYSYDRNLDRVDVEAHLAGSAEDLGDEGWDPEYGWGRVNAQGALELLLAGSMQAVFSPDVEGRGRATDRENPITAPLEESIPALDSRSPGRIRR